MWPSRRLIQTGLFGVTESIHACVGSSPPQFSWSQSPFVIHVPAGTVLANAAIRRMNSSFVRRIAQLNRRQREAAVDEMHVRVGESGDDHGPVRVDDPRRGRRALPDLGARADERDAIARDGDGIGPRMRGVARPDAGIDDGEGDHRGLREWEHSPITHAPAAQ